MPVIQHKALRNKFTSSDLQIKEVALKLGWSNTYLSLRLCRKQTFDTKDIYCICDKLGIAVEQIHIYFPSVG